MLCDKIYDIFLYYQNLSYDLNEPNENKNIININPNHRSSKSKVYKFENFLESRNTTEGKFNNLFFYSL